MKSTKQDDRYGELTVLALKMGIPAPLLARTLLMLVLGLSSAGAQAQSQGKSNQWETETKWPGIRYQVYRVERLPPDRLVVGVRIFATPQAKASGTLIGAQVLIPRDPTRQDLQADQYAPRPLSLASSEMIDEQTEQKYPALPPSPSAERQFMPSAIFCSLRPGQAEILSVQFAVPALLALSETDGSKRTVSFLFPNAKGPITKVPLPSQTAEPQ